MKIFLLNVKYNQARVKKINTVLAIGSEQKEKYIAV